MQSCRNSLLLMTQRKAVFATVLLATLVFGNSIAHAASTDIATYENPNVPTVFNLDFPELGISSTSNVIATRFTMEIDADAGTARFTSYDQYVESLQLPLGITTGLIHVRVISSNGTYDPQAQTFVTNDEYEISFANDLSSFGFTSPVIIPSTSQGNFVSSTARGQTVQMVWNGEGELENSQNPEEPYKYTYTCSSNTVIEAPENIPPLPNLSCGAGTCGATGGLAMMLMFVGMGMLRIRPRHRR